jgi:hypothetical protein
MAGTETEMEVIIEIIAVSFIAKFLFCPQCFQHPPLAVQVPLGNAETFR